MEVIICIFVSAIIFICGYVIVRLRHTEYVKTTAFEFRSHGKDVVKPNPFADDEVYILRIQKRVFGQLVSEKFKLVQDNWINDDVDEY